jgi:hypothetical protein
VLGLKQFCFSCLILNFVSTLAWGHVPKASQILRFQPQVLKTQKPFRVKGSVLRQDGQKVPSEILWNAQGDYQVVVSQIPRSFFFSDSSKSTPWILRRHPKLGCQLTAEGSTYSCGESSFWAYSELSAMPDTTAKSYAQSGFISAQEIALEETDGRALGALPAFERNGQAQTPTVVTVAEATQNFRVQPALGMNGRTPVAVLEIRGDNFVPNSDKKENSYPLLHFDPTFLVPLVARWKTEGTLYTIKAQSDLEVRRKRPRFSHVLAKNIEVFEGLNFLAGFDRAEAEANLKAASLAVPIKSALDISNLRSLLSSEGQSFLSALLLTH